MGFSGKISVGGLTVNERILFCNVAYMKYYDADEMLETPINGGEYVKVTKDAYEKWNFHTCEDGYYYGFVETKYSDGYQGQKQPKQLHIEKIDSEFSNKNEIPGVTVVFCALPESGPTVIVGWYKNATVFRNRPSDIGRMYNIKAKATDGTLIPENKRKFTVPRAKQYGYGFGQANVWYAAEPAAQDYVKRVLEYIEENNAVDRNPYDTLPQEFAESGVATKVSVNRYERNPMARKECLRIYGYRCTVCGFDAGETYGPEFKNLIQVHHIVPIHTIGADYRVDPGKDLIPVCPNCHMILHTKVNGKEPSLAELRERMMRKL